MTRTTGGRPAVVADETLRRLAPRTWLGGSPLRVFRLTEAGDAVVEGLRRDGIGPAGAGVTDRGGAVAELVDRLVLAGAAHPLPGPGPSMLPAVTVVVPVRDRPDQLDRALASLGDLPTAVLVVDDSSADAGAVARVAARHGATVLRREGRAGPAAARNAGLAQVRTSAVAFVDSDVTCTPGWAEPLLGHLADERVAMAGPRVRSAPGEGLLADYERSRSPLDLGDRPSPVHPRARVSYLPAAALVARTEALRSIGGFDESLRFGEDVDAVWRLVEEGWAVRYEPVATVLHDPRPDWRGWVGQRFAYGSSAAGLDRRHPGAVAPVVCSGWSAGVWGLVAVGHPVLGAAVGLGSAAALTRRLPEVPVAEAGALALRGHLGAGRQLARAALRPWWPALLTGAMVSGRARRVLGAVVVDRMLRGDEPVAHRALGIADDVAYGAGVWWGAWRSRRPGALLPAFPRWP